MMKMTISAVFNGGSRHQPKENAQDRPADAGRFSFFDKSQCQLINQEYMRKTLRY